jgi:hypothetical protein
VSRSPVAADGSERRRILLLCDDRRSHAGNVRRHIDGFRRCSRHDVRIVNPTGVDAARALDFDAFDAVVVHYTLVVALDNYLSPWFREQLAAYDGLKIQFIQDEYRWVDQITAAIRELGIDVLYSVVQPEAVEAIYGPRLPAVEVLTTLAGFAPDGPLAGSATPLGERSLDVGYRGRAVPFWLGSLGQEKLWIGQRFLPEARRRGLRCDIEWSENDRIYGRGWERFLASCRATLGTESGASIVDFDGSIERRTAEYIAAHPTASFSEVHAAVLRSHDSKHVIRVISPRIFEAAAARTGLVLFPGEYSGLIREDEHYIRLEKDMSNVDDVIDRVRDTTLVAEQTERTYEDLVSSGRYSIRTFIQGFDELVSARAEPRGRIRPRPAATAVVRLAVGRRAADRGRPVQVALRALAELRLVAGNVEARRLALSLAVGRRGRGSRPRRVWEDLVRLALLIEARQGRLRYVGDPFTLDASFREETCTLTIAGVPGSELRSLDHARDPVRNAIFTGRLGAIVWRHIAIGPTVDVEALPGIAVQVPVGFYGTPGSHEFSALRELARDRPAETAAAVDAMLGGGAPALPARASALGRLLSNPRAALSKAALTLAATLRCAELRALVLAYLRSPDARAVVSPEALLEDVLKLHLLESAIRRGEASATLDGGHRTLVLRSSDASHHGRPRGCAAAADAVDTLVWDRSEVGTVVEARLAGSIVRVELGPDGVHEFDALHALGPHLQAETASALLRLGRAIENVSA